LQGVSNFAVRVSEIESHKSALSLAFELKKYGLKVDWVWVDCFNGLPLPVTEINELKSAGYKVCYVSPELHHIENTEIFPEFLKNISKEKYKIYGEEMEKHEKKILKKLKVKHFIKFIKYVEKQLNINDINLFTNKIIEGIADL
jgi:glycosyltransferase involved in cell wall biosynthesis